MWRMQFKTYKLSSNIKDEARSSSKFSKQNIKTKIGVQNTIGMKIHTTIETKPNTH